MFLTLTKEWSHLTPKVIVVGSLLLLISFFFFCFFFSAGMKTDLVD
jgi:hypothetical protein